MNDKPLNGTFDQVPESLFAGLEFDFGRFALRDIVDGNLHRQTAVPRNLPCDGSEPNGAGVPSCRLDLVDSLYTRISPRFLLQRPNPRCFVIGELLLKRKGRQKFGDAAIAKNPRIGVIRKQGLQPAINGDTLNRAFNQLLKALLARCNQTLQPVPLRFSEQGVLDRDGSL